MRTALLIIGLVLFAAPSVARRQGRLAKAVLTQSHTGQRARVARHAGRYSLRADIFGAFSGHGIGWGARTAL